MDRCSNVRALPQPGIGPETGPGVPCTVDEAPAAQAWIACPEIEPRRYGGVHPGIGALDALPLLPFPGLSLAPDGQGRRDLTTPTGLEKTE
jgi:hypothetical protein